MTFHSVSVIICCYTLDRLQDIRDAVASVLAQSTPPSELVLAVDHNQALLDHLRADLLPAVRRVRNEGAHGLSETRNVGVHAATSEIVAFLDDDAVAEPGWLEALSQPFADPQVVGVGGKAVPQWLNDEKPVWLPEELYWIVGCTYHGMPIEGRTLRNPLGCNAAFRAAVLRQIGSFDTGLGRTGRVQGAAEETELSLRITNALPGARIVYEPRAVVRHKVSASRLTLGYLLRRSFEEGRGKARLEKNLVSLPIAASALSTERSYLRHLLGRAIPTRLASPLREGALSQASAIALAILATGAGYVLSKVRG